MSKASVTELQTRISDLDGALKAIGRIVADNAITPKRRLERVQGVLALYGATAPTEPAVQS